MAAALDPILTTGHDDHLVIEFGNWVAGALEAKAAGKLVLPQEQEQH